MRNKAISLALLLFLLVLGVGCGINSKALHINYHENENYGTGDYLFSTVTFSGSALGQENVFSVEELEEMASDKELGYEGPYSMLTRGARFSRHNMTGLRLYEFLLKVGLPGDADENTQVQIISADGYVCILPLKEIKESNDNTYSSMSDQKPQKKGVPVILAFGSDGVPLTGPVGEEKPGDKVKEKDGFVEGAQNVGGPVRLIAGQKEAGEYNAPDNAKWVRKVIVGEPVEYSKHQGDEAKKTALRVRVIDKHGHQMEEKAVSYEDLEAFPQKERNYYGKKDFYEGANLWAFLAATMEFSSREGTVKLVFSDGKEEELPMEYFRNLKGDYRGYTTVKDGLTITGVKPALGFSINGKPSGDGVYALLPKAKGHRKASDAKVITDIEIRLSGERELPENPYGNHQIRITGDGVKEEKVLTINEMELYHDLIITNGNETGISLKGLLDVPGLSVDAGIVTVKGSAQKTFTQKELDNGRDSILLVTRENGKAPATGGPIKLGNVTGITEITVGVEKGLWTHTEKPYTKYRKETLKISGSQAKETKTYKLEELEKSENQVKDSFGAAGGIDGYQGLILKDLIRENLKPGVDKPTKITVVGGDGYRTTLSVEDVWKGIDSKYQPDQHREVILAYSINGAPLVANEKSKGFNGENGFGPLRLIVENQHSKWVKDVEEIIIGK